MRGMRERNTRIRAAYLVNVTVFEEKGGRALDLGLFQKPVRLRSSKIDKAQQTVRVIGLVRGEVRAQGGSDPKIDLKRFNYLDGKGETLKLETDAEDIKLEKVDGHASFLRVTLKPSPGEKKSWQLHVEVDPKACQGPIREEISLRILRQGRQPRLINIPVVGTADR